MQTFKNTGMEASTKLIISCQASDWAFSSKPSPTP